MGFSKPFPERNASREKHKQVTLKELMEKNSQNFANPAAFLVDSTSPTEAALLQYLHSWIEYKKRSVDSHRRSIHRGKMWVYVTLTKLHEDTGLCRQALINALNSLKKKGLLSIDNFNALSYDRTKWYTLNYSSKLLLRLRFPHTYDKPERTEAFSNKLDEEMEDTKVYPVDEGLVYGVDEASLSGRPTIPAVQASIHAPVRDSLRSSRRPASDLHEPLQKSTEGSAISGKRGLQTKMPHEHHSGSGESVKKKQVASQVAKMRVKLNESGKVFQAHQFWLTLMSHYGVSSFLSFSKKEAGMLKTLVKELTAAGIPPADFLEFVVANWTQIRAKLTWPDNPKKFRLGEKPFFQEVIFNKNDLISLWEHRESMPVAAASKTEYVFHSVKEIPLSHPHRDRLIQQLETLGKAVSYIKGD